LNWQEQIFIKLNLHENANKIIIDNTGLIISEKFTSYLKDSGKDFYITHDVVNLVKTINEHKKIIIITKLHPISLPSNLKKQTEIVDFNFADLPFNLPTQFYKRVSTEEIIKSLEYIIHENIKTDEVKKSTVKDILNNANLFALNAEFKRHFELLTHLFEKECNYDNILQIGYSLGKLNYLAWKTNKNLNDELVKKVDGYVSNYILSGKLKRAFYEPISTFKTVDKIRDYIKSQKRQKMALICFDGMGVSEWFVLKDHLEQCNFRIKDRFIFSMIPSNTIISRSAIFYGDLETVYNLSYSNEQKTLKKYFKDYHVKFFREEEQLDHKNLLGVNFVSIIYNIFDNIAHSTKLPPNDKNKNIYFKSVFNYLEKSCILKNLEILIEEKYKIYICSDHGCVVAQGNSQKIDKWLQDQYCKRACIVKNDELVKNLKHIDCDTLEIPFDNTRLTLLAKNRTMFDSAKKNKITHGGITVEEIVVPFIEVN